MTANIETGDSALETLTYHGGNLSAARIAFPNAPRPWLDLSTGINGRPYPIGPLDPAVFARLPEPAAVAQLEAAAARAYECDADQVVAAPGTQALLQWLPRLFSAGRVGILGPTYAEHGRTWRAGGAHVEELTHPADLAGFGVAVVVNPNNPDGRLLGPKQLTAIAAQNDLLVVDEAFADALPAEASLLPHGLPENAIVLRSFGKFYGLAGLRLGFAVTAPGRAAIIREALGPWAVSGEALAIGTRALADDAWKAETIARLTTDAGRFDALGAGAGLDYIGGTPLFRLHRRNDGRSLFVSLARAGILVRPFAHDHELLRFGIPADEDVWDRLAAVLA